MNIPILTTAQQQLAAVFEPIMAMMRDLIERSKASNKPSVRDKDSPSCRPREGEEPQLLAAAEIYDHLYSLDPRTMRGVCLQNFGAELRSFGVMRTKIGNRRVYEVVKSEG